MPLTPDPLSLSTRLDRVLDGAADDLIVMLSDSSRYRPRRRLHELALESAGLTADEFEYMGEHDDRNPKYTLYYSELTNMLQKLLGRTIDRLSY